VVRNFGNDLPEYTALTSKKTAVFTYHIIPSLIRILGFSTSVRVQYDSSHILLSSYRSVNFLNSSLTSRDLYCLRGAVLQFRRDF
jgi:hypothetical protein